MNWLWGSTPATPATQHENQTTGSNSAPSTPMHQRALHTITQEDKDQFFRLFQEYATEEQDKDAIICVDTPTLKIWRKQLPG
jgi:hypothetical protein